MMREKGGESEHEEEEQEDKEKGCSFEWDETSQLYYHPSSRFYHDPTAGWYYNSKDGLYYKFENGNYVLMESVEGNQSEVYDNLSDAPNSSIQDDLNTGGKHVNTLDSEDTEAHRLGFCTDNYPTVDLETSDQTSDFPPPPSEWLEDTLIDLYLSGHSNRETNVVQDAEMPAEAAHDDVLGSDDIYELEEGEWIPEEGHNVDYASESISDEGVSWDEDNWRAQYGQVIPCSKEPHPKILAIDLWDWALVKETKRKRKRQVAHLVGRLVRQSTKLHPSVSSKGRLLKTAHICEVHLNQVRVRSGKVYKLKIPSAKYLASLSTYDSSNPTKYWGFPELSFDMQIQAPRVVSENSGVKVIKGGPVLIDSALLPDKNGGGAYRDRAAERRALHGGFGVGPGQKKSANDDDDCEPSYPTLPEEAEGESLNLSFGAGSYAQKLLKNMGWKEGEALGCSSKGMIEPLQAVGNNGNAGLGWDQNERRHV